MNKMTRNNNSTMRLPAFPLFPGDPLDKGEKYRNQAIRWLEKGSHYELIFTDDFVTPSSGGMERAGLFSRFGNNALLTDIIEDMRDGDREKEVHVFVGSFGGEVAALSMILQQLLTYPRRIGINLGTACSCGWMLLFACQERYVSAFSQNMYHDMSAMSGGKHSELRSNAEFMGRWQKELLKVTDTAKVLTPQELELGRTSEVWLTGAELIERKAARDYNDYLCRRTPMEAHGIYRCGRMLLEESPFGWLPYQPAESKPLSYDEVMKMLNSPEPESPAKRIAKKSKKIKKTSERSGSGSLTV